MFMFAELSFMYMSELMAGVCII